MASCKKVVFLVIIYATLNCYSAFKITENEMPDDEMVDRAIEKLMSPNDEQAPVEKRTANGECNHQLKFPESASIITENNNRTINGLTASITYCSPQKFPVPISVPLHWIIYPTAVTLTRCYGATHTTIRECTATKKEKVRVSYSIFSGSVSTGYADMWNHIECAPQCKIKPEHCNVNQTYSPEQCDCLCDLPDNTQCDGDRIFKKDKCECQCRLPQSCGLYREWDPKSCSCTCAKCMRDLCTRQNMIMDEATCQCQ